MAGDQTGFRGMDRSMFSEALQQGKQSDATPAVWSGENRQLHEGTINECGCKGHKFYSNSDGGLVPCVCLQDGWVEVCRQNCGVTGEVLGRNSFDHFARDLNPDAWRHKVVIEKYGARDTGSPWLVLFGNVGTGKTHLLIALTEMLVDRGVAVFYTNGYSMAGQLRNSIESHSVEEYVLQMIRRPLLIIDDLGTEMHSKFISSTFFYILNERYMLRRRTVLAFNKEGWDKLDQRLQSRISDAVVCHLLHFDGADVRPTVRS